MTQSQLETPPTISRIELDSYWSRIQNVLGGVLQSAIGDAGEAVYLDYPLHSNVGDLLIYAGTEKWFSGATFAIRGRWHFHNFVVRPLPPETVILLHGGGNFGDLYLHQRFRERVIRAYPANPIVVLPQTIHYERREALEESARVLNGHGSVHLLLRDRVSFELAGNYFSSCRRSLAPDMASLLYPLSTQIDHDVKTEVRKPLYLLRNDRERPARTQFAAPHGSAVDWPQLLGVMMLEIRIYQLAGRYLGLALPARRFARKWLELTQRIIHRVNRRISGTSEVVTSRLHGHILASLFGVPNRVLDNSYGKNGRYFETWSRELGIASLEAPIEPRSEGSNDRTATTTIESTPEPATGKDEPSTRRP